MKCGIEYPKGNPMEKVREIRDDLEQKVTRAVIVFHPNLSKWIKRPSYGIIWFSRWKQ
jgi:hypothetical protein